MIQQVKLSLQELGELAQKALRKDKGIKDAAYWGVDRIGTRYLFLFGDKKEVQAEQRRLLDERKIW